MKNELGTLWKELVLPYLEHVPGLPEVAEENDRNSRQNGWLRQWD